MARRDRTRAVGTANAAVPGDAAQVAAAPRTNMYREPNNTPAGQPAPAPTNVVSWMDTIQHLGPGPGTADQTGGSGAGDVASEEDE